MKIGIACITYNRPAHLQHWTKQVAEFSPQDAVFHIANDTPSAKNERKGVAYRSNECLRELYDAGCEYFFLFNDDCFPIKKGWAEFFIEASKASGQQHFMYLKPTPGVCLKEEVHLCPKGEETFKGSLMDTPINTYDNCNGCMMFFTRECIDKVGGFSPRFGIYGMEHCNMSNRIHRAGLTPLGAYSCPAGASEYIYSLDLDSSRPELRKQLKHKSSMSPNEAVFHAQKGMRVYQEDTTLYYPLT